MTDSNSEIFRDIILAKWSDRFLAWLIDVIIISSILWLIVAVIFGTFDSDWSGSIMMIPEWASFTPASVLFLCYWIILEYKTGQSIGKKIFRLKLVNIDGKSPSLMGVIVSSFGKSFLLPIDFILGLIFTNEKRQRIFNKIGDTIVLKIKEEQNESENIKYTKD
ncbi:MAG: RDD family protein [Nitrosopumilus sp.]|nr:RDD family protein [Nitrosopumilus sp.]MDH3385691.1 RDD family protein [Nitrosopumilus sp.]